MKRKTHRLTARSADKHELYEIAAQRPEVMIGFIEDLAEMMKRREMVTLREDFCGTANLASQWVGSAPGREAVGVDWDEKVLEWAKTRGFGDEREAASGGRSGPRKWGGVKLVCGDVMEVNAKCDVLASLNFSHGIYKAREEMLGYLRHARKCIRAGGMMVMDTFGGPGAMEKCVDERDFGEFVYQWEQAKFNPLTNEILCHIHFRFRDGSVKRKAFTYDWRLWSLPELREMLLDAGFEEVGIWFEGEEGFIDERDGMNDHAWVGYVVGFSRGAGDGA
ncbi:MAG: class I SAM-dependent methyltransferase [Phycisphaeraceae bacterium]